MNWDVIGRATNINLDLFLEMVNFCIDSSYFRFRDKYYQQQFGTAMGSPLSPILAELVMETLLRTVTKRLNFPVPVLRKYVDDLILALPEDQIENTLNIFNGYNQHLQFTVEKEEQGRLPFLDTLVIRNPDQSISTQWYSKPISSGRLLNYHSFHPASMKINVAANFIKRVTTLTTNQTWEQQSNIIFQHLRRNNYPSALINRLINRAKTTATTAQHQQPLQYPSQYSQTNVPPATAPSSQHSQANNPPAATPPSQYSQANNPPTAAPPSQHSQTNDPSAATLSPQHSQSNNPPNAAPPSQHSQTNSPPTAPPDDTPTTNQHHHTAFRSIPYIANLSPTIASLLKNDYPQVKVAYRTLKTTNSVLRPVKDPVDTLDQYNVIYSLTCIDCQKIYIGMTRNQLKTRISGHRSNINQYTKLTQNTNINTDEIQRLGEKTAVMKHIIEESHMFNLTHPKILDKTNKLSTLPMLEMCHIAHTPNTVNHRTDVQGLSSTYAGLLHTIKKTTKRNRNTNTADHTLHDHLAHDDDDNEPL